MSFLDRIAERLPARTPPIALGLETPVRIRQSVDQSGQRLVPAGTTWSQILDYVEGTGAEWPLDLYQPGLSGGVHRNSAISFATLNRAVTLISSMIAQLVTGGNLTVVDRDGYRVKTRRAEQVIDILSTSMDGGITPSYSHVEDGAVDYLLDGNALYLPTVADGMLTKITRMLSWDSTLTYGEQGSLMYRLTPTDGTLTNEYAAALDVIHIRWPRLLRYGRSQSTREGFALSPVVALRPALEIGLRGDNYIRDWFTRGARSKLHVDYKTPDGEQFPPEEMRTDLRAAVSQFTNTRSPLVTFDATTSKIEDTPQDTEAAALRDFQVMEIARVYGIPAPLIGVNVTQWGKGIEQLAKLFYRFGGRAHLERFLAPIQLRLLSKGNRFHVDTTDLLRGDSDSIQKMLMSVSGDAQRDPITSIQERRKIAGLARDPDGEITERVKSEPAEPSAPEPDPEPDPPENPDSVDED